ncbi:hypothetical protein CWE03_07825 [Lactobacillus johnsonii]|nr:hypothetical protein CWE03_07825 [Lactobacillus johnsonii]
MDKEFENLVSTKINSSAEYNNFIDVLASTKEDNALVCFLGAGTSISQGYKDWNGYVQDLIQYWKTHLQDLLGQNSFYSSVQATDISFLDWLNDRSGYSNKRKVDMVHHMIKKYCKSKSMAQNDEEKTKYLEHVNDFEKYYFLEINPIKKINEIIDQVLNLSAIFITTNYDNQIEKAYEATFQSRPNILKDIHALENIDKLADKSILHMHGTPVTPGVLLVSSSDSYNQLYLNNNNAKKKIETQLIKQNAHVLLFIGSSLQEEEVLNLFSSDSLNLKKYALMQLRDDISEDQANLVKEYYREEKNIEIIWYGHNYSDLPIFLQKMNKDISDKYQEKHAFVSAKELIDDIDKNNLDQLNKDITRALFNEETFIDDCFRNRLNKDSINLLVNNSKFVNELNKGKYYHNFWSEVNRKFSKLNEKTRFKIIKIIEKSSEFFGDENTMNILYKYRNDFDYLYENGKKFLNRVYYPINISSNEARVIWLLVNLEENSIFYTFDNLVEYELNENILFNFSSAALKKLIEILNKKKMLLQTSIEQILENEPIKVLEYLFMKNRIVYKSGAFPKYFYRDSKLIQRLLINLSLSDNFPKVFDFDQLLNNIDFNDKLMGKEMNKFVQKFAKDRNIKSNYYIDGWYTFDMTLTPDRPFFEVQQPTDQRDVKKIIKNLKEALNLKSKQDDKNIIGQKEQLLKVLKNSESWKNFSHINNYFLEEAISDDTILKNYLNEINKILIAGAETNKLEFDIVKQYFNRFNFCLESVLPGNNFEFLKYISINGTLKQKKILYDYLFNDFKLKNSDFYYNKENKTKWISLEDFVNTVAYQYVSLVDDMIKNDRGYFEKNYKSKFKDTILRLSKHEREYMKGRFYIFFEKDNPITEDEFIGFSHSYRINENIANRATNAVTRLLNTEFSDEFCKQNIILTLIYCIKPMQANIKKPIKAESYKNLLFSSMINYFLKQEQELEEKNNVLDWIRWYLRNIPDALKIVLNAISRNINNTSACELIFKEILQNRKYINKKYEMSYIYFREDRSYSKDSLRLMAKVIEGLFINGLLVISHSLTFNCSEVVKKMAENNYQDLIKDFLEVTKQFLLPEDQKELEVKYLRN